MKYTSNVDKVVLDLEKRLKNASDVSSLQRLVATYLMGSNDFRIHNEGLDVGNKPIGSYSVKPIYVNPNKSPKSFEPKGKTGRVKFKNGKPHATRYFVAGYFGFRATIGRDISKVNLQLTGRLRLDWALAQQGKNWVVGFNSSYGTEVAQGNEDRFNTKIWGITAQDKTEVVKIQNDFIKKALAKT